MTAIVFKAKVTDIYNHDDSFSHKQIALPKTIKSDHIEGAQSHRMFSGKVAPAMIDIRAKKLLNDMELYSVRLDRLPANVSISGDYLATVRIEL